MLSNQQISDNWDTFLQNVIECTQNNKDRQNKLLSFYNDEERKYAFAMIPASSKIDHHSAFPGGYVFHVNRVVELSKYLYRLWSKYDGVEGFTEEELVFSAIHHDLGKYGNMNTVLYVPVTDKWKLDKGQFYEYNPSVEFMSIPDRSLFLLNQIGITLTSNEFVAIKTHDGLYDDANKIYLMSSSKLPNNITYVLHQADMLAARTEYHMVNNKKQQEIVQQPETKPLDSTLKDILNSL